MLTRHSPLRRYTPMRKQSPKHRASQSELRRNAAIRKRMCGGRCEIGLPKCLGAGSQPHHVKLRSQGGDHSVENLRWSCAVCHDLVHRNVAESVARGWIKQRVELFVGSVMVLVGQVWMYLTMAETR